MTKMIPKEHKQEVLDLFMKLGIIESKSNDDVLIKFNQGGILYISVKRECVLK